MAVNPFFAGDRPQLAEMELRESLIVEAIQIYGTEVLYVPRKWVATDDLLKEVTVSTFPRSYQIEAFVSGLENMVRSAYIMDKLGLSSLQTSNVQVVMSKQRFRETIPDAAVQYPGRPNDGDLIYIPQTSTLLEIKEANPEGQLRSGGQLHVYTMSCELFASNNELVNGDPSTGGVSDVDGVPQILLQGQLFHDDTIKPGVTVIDNTKTGSNDMVDDIAAGIIIEEE